MLFGMVPLEFEPAVERITAGGMPDFSKFDIVETVREAVNIDHIDVIELTGDIEHVIPGSISPEIVGKLGELMDELGHGYTVHLPLWSIEPATFNEHIRQGSIDSIVNTIKTFEPLEPEFYVLHATGALATEFSQLDMPEKMVYLIGGYMTQFGMDSVGEVLARTEIDPRRIAIENVEFPFELTREIVDAHDTSICFDTGHSLAHFSGDESVIEFYRRHKDRITEIHLNDGTFKEVEGVKVTDDHMAIGTGDLPVRDMLMELVKDNFSGPCIFELTTDEVHQSLAHIKEVVPEALTQS